MSNQFGPAKHGYIARGHDELKVPLLPSVSQINNSERLSVSYVTGRSHNVSPILISGQTLSNILERGKKPKSKRKSTTKSDLSEKDPEDELDEKKSPS